MVAIDRTVDFVYDKQDFVTLLRNSSSQSGGGFVEGSSPRFIGTRHQRGGRGIAGIIQKIRYAFPAFIRSPIGRNRKNWNRHC